MAEIGVFLSSEEHGPSALVQLAQMSEEAGFRSVLISDHFHPWTDRQGESPFVWSVIGGIASTTRLRVTTGVTCPIGRTGPAVVAHASMTSQLLLDGRFVLGVGSGEALNEHICGEKWPTAQVRLEMLEEAIGVIRELWTGKLTTHRGRYFTVENARLYSCAAHPPPIAISAFGSDAMALAARVGDGLVSTRPDAGVLHSYRALGGGGPTIAALKICWGDDESAARRLAFEDAVAEKIPCGPDPERHAETIRAYLEAGFDEVYVSQIGPDQAGFLDFFNKELRHRLEA
jgi:G6PDH family F420-dependent oxidoreductase